MVVRRRLVSISMMGFESCIELVVRLLGISLFPSKLVEIT